MSANPGLASWHRVMTAGSPPEALAAIVAEDAVFHSPVVHTPQRGREKVVLYLASAGRVFAASGFAYVRELVDGHEACLEFTATIDGITINGIDLIEFDRDWMIRDFKVMVRPLKAINLLWEKMAVALEDS